MKTYILENAQLKAVIREKSAELISLVKKENGQEYLWNADPEFWGWTSPILFPVVGNFRDKQYTYQGKTYSMVQHGFARHRNFQRDAQTDTEIWMSLEDDEETYQQYPFHFRLELGYRLQGTSIEVLWKVINKDDTEMYFSIGGHPAVLCPIGEEKHRTECYLGFETEKTSAEYRMVDVATARIGKEHYALELEDGMHKITKGMFDLDALIFDNYQIKTAFLAGADKKPYIKLHTETPLTAFWSPKENAPFICFEPWFGMADEIDFHGTLEERAWQQKLEGKGIFTSSYTFEIM